MVRRKRLFWTGLAAAAIAVVWLALPYHPGYQEWRCRNQTLERLQALERQMPESPIVLYYLGQALHQAGRSADAVPVLQRAARFDADSVRIREALVEAQLAAGQTRETFDMLRRFLETHPDKPEAYRMLGRFLMGVRTYSRAIIVLEQATLRFPNDGENWKLLASARQQFRDFSGARNAVTRATTLLPKDADAFLLQARIFRDAGIADARLAYDTAMQLAPKDIDLRAEYADYLARRATSPQDYIAATDYARRVLQEKPGQPQAEAALGLALAERGETDAALPPLRRSVERNLQDVRLLRALGRVYRKKGDIAEAARWAEAAQRAQAYRDEKKRLLDGLEARPQDPALLRGMAKLSGRNGDAPTAARYYGIALRQPPDAAAPLLATARDLKDGGFTDAARQMGERSRQNSPSPSERAEAETFLNSLR